jgi:hypothetical protein
MELSKTAIARGYTLEDVIQRKKITSKFKSELKALGLDAAKFGRALNIDYPTVREWIRMVPPHEHIWTILEFIKDIPEFRAEIFKRSKKARKATTSELEA